MKRKQSIAVKNGFVMMLAAWGYKDLAGQTPTPQTAKYTWDLMRVSLDETRVYYKLNRRGYRAKVVDKHGRLQDTWLISYKRFLG